jgi:hypothetical protein
MPISPTVAQLGDLGFGGGLLGQQTDAELEEERRKKRLGLSAAANGSASVKALLGGLSGMGGPNFNVGGMR